MGEMADMYNYLSDWELDYDPHFVKRQSDQTLVQTVQLNIAMVDLQVREKFAKISEMFDILPQLNRYNRIFVEQIVANWEMYGYDYIVELSNIHYNPETIL